MRSHHHMSCTVAWVTRIAVPIGLQLLTVALSVMALFPPPRVLQILALLGTR